MIASRQYVTELLENEGLKPNRNLGQNFFINGQLLSDLIRNVPLSGMQVIEIGPGPGALTEILLSRSVSVLAVEKDPNMVRLLKQALPTDKLQVTEGDVLRFKPDAVARPFTVAGNLPYFITAEIVEKVFRWQPEQMLFMLQKEASDRFFAKPSAKNYMPLGIACSLYYTAKKLGDISPENYLPPPAVTSSMVFLKKREDAPAEDPSALLSFLNQCFRMRRKTLLNNISDHKNAKEALEALGLPPSVRAEALPPETLLELYRSLA